ncbi:pilus assembly protein [Pseudorhodoferax sp.]|uniref:pilus assembly protein n=1 Tax=Pseudorhodoferax sp. TaxID=1993553 RepID=UPI002DD67592|nr:PilC/PilY family type IV pilus protein [Pseudorhodoferax sp.]
MNTLTISACMAALLLCSSMVRATPQASAITSAAGSTPHSPRLFIGWQDPATGIGDVQALDSPAATNMRWSAAAQLQARPTTAPRVLLSAGLNAGTAAWSALAARFGSAPLGAVRNANLWHAGGRNGDRRGMVYAGAHDGMLHGFAADDGSELLAYLPRRLQARPLPGTPAVDGPLFGGDAPIGADGAMRTLLVAGLGSGGKGYVVLDVSAPDQFAAARAADVALLDTTDGADADIGQLHAPPVLDDANAGRARHVVQMANGRWALVIGNGHFSAGGRPALLIQYLDQARELMRLSPCMAGAPCVYAGDNGLAMPRLLDTDGDGRVDLAYAGDLQGQLWRFDLRGAESDWHVQRFFTACDADGRRQPITTAPYAQPHPLGGLMLVVGTGRHLHDGDSAAAATQSLYGLHDRGTANPLQADEPGCRRPDSLHPLAYGDTATAQGVEYHAVRSTLAARAAPQQHSGWWIDLPHAGQRVLHNPQGFEGYKLLVRSVVPSGGALQPRTAGRAYLSVLNLLTGQASTQAAFAAVDGTLAAQPLGMASAPAGPAVLFRRPNEAWLRFADGQQLVLRTGVTVGARTGWREQP